MFSVNFVFLPAGKQVGVLVAIIFLLLSLRQAGTLNLQISQKIVQPHKFKSEPLILNYELKDKKYHINCR